VWKDWIRLKKEFAALDEELPPAKLLPAERKKRTLDPTKRDASKDDLGRRARAGGNMWHLLSSLRTLLESFDKNNPDSDGDKQFHGGKTDASKDGAALLGQHS